MTVKSMHAKQEPSRTKRKNAAIAAKSAALPKIPKKLLDQIVAEGPITALQVNVRNAADVRHLNSLGDSVDEQ